MNVSSLFITSVLTRLQLRPLWAMVLGIRLGCVFRPWDTWPIFLMGLHFSWRTISSHLLVHLDASLMQSLMPYHLDTEVIVLVLTL
jgi:hypothetical protein